MKCALSINKVPCEASRRVCRLPTIHWLTAGEHVQAYDISRPAWVYTVPPSARLKYPDSIEDLLGSFRRAVDILRAQYPTYSLQRGSDLTTAPDTHCLAFSAPLASQLSFLKFDLELWAT